MTPARPPVPPPRQSWIQEVRARLGSPPARRLAGAAAAELRLAAVLVPLYVDAAELWTVLTKRTATLASHPSQIAFAGGSREVGEDPWAAALREAREEVGLDPRQVVRLGELDEQDVPSGFRIVPCVGAIPHLFELRPSEAEIAEVLRLPLAAFTNPRLVEERPLIYDGVRRSLRVYHVGSRQIWGVTARILHNLLERLGLETAAETAAES